MSGRIGLICISPFLNTYLWKKRKMIFVDIKNDIAFRKIFGNDEKTAPLISFLNAALQLEGNDQVESVTLLGEKKHLFWTLGQQIIQVEYLLLKCRLPKRMGSINAYNITFPGIIPCSLTLEMIIQC
jgi:hypothetical protein